MGDNCGAIHLRWGKRTLDPLVDAIIAYYATFGARPGPSTWRRISPLTLTQGRDTGASSGPLGTALRPTADGWITLVQSERYYADAGLAEHLAERFETTAFWSFRGDASGSRQLFRLGRAFRWSDVPTEYDNTYYDQLDGSSGDGWTFLSVDAVPAEAFLLRPRAYPDATVQCRYCMSDFQWELGNGNREPPPDLDLEAATTKEPDDEEVPFVRLRETAGATNRATVLLRLRCPVCRHPEAAWLKASWDRGLISSVKRIKELPAELGGSRYDFVYGERRVPRPGELPPGEAEGFATSESASAADWPFGGEVEIDEALSDALARLVQAPGAESLARVRGRRVGVVETDGFRSRVRIADAQVIDQLSRAECFALWLRALLLTVDPVRAQQVFESSTIADWAALADEFNARDLTIAGAFGDEWARMTEARRRPDLLAQPLDALLAATDSGDAAAARALETVAINERKLVVWRYARAVSDGKPQALRDIFRSRIAL